MTAETITPNEDEITPCDNYGAISSREPCCDHGRQLDHLDTMLHTIMQEQARQAAEINGIGVLLGQLSPLVPLVPRALALLDPGAAMRPAFRRKGRNAIQERASAPVYVRPAPSDSGPVGA